MHWFDPWRRPCSGSACWADRSAIAPYVSTVGKRSGAWMSEGEGRAPPSLHLNRSAARAGKAGTAIGRIDNAPSKSNAPIRATRGAPSSSTAYRAEHGGFGSCVQRGCEQTTRGTPPSNLEAMLAGCAANAKDALASRAVNALPLPRMPQQPGANEPRSRRSQYLRVHPIRAAPTTSIDGLRDMKALVLEQHTNSSCELNMPLQVGPRDVKICMHRE